MPSLQTFFEPQLQAPVGAQLEAVLRERRAGDVASESLELAAIASIDELFGVHVDAQSFGYGRVGLGTRSGARAASGRSSAPPRRRGAARAGLRARRSPTGHGRRRRSRQTDLAARDSGARGRARPSRPHPRGWGGLGL